MNNLGASIEGSGLDVFARSALQVVSKEIETGSGLTITPSALSTSLNNYEPPQWANSVNVRLSSSGPVNLTGFGSLSDGKRKKLINVGTNTITIVHDSASSAEQNRVLCAGGVNISIVANKIVDIFYDGISKRWRA